VKRADFKYLAIITALALHAIVLAILNYVPMQHVDQELDYMPVDMAEFEELPEEKTLEEILAERIQEDVANLVADANTERSSQRESYSSRRQEQRAEQEVDQELEDFAREEFERVRQERAQREAANPDEDVAPDDDRKLTQEELDAYDYHGQSYNGKVTGEVNVPGREVRYLHIPGYKCRGGGVVVLNIIVDRAGDVIEAEIDPARSNYSGDCMPSEALSSAQKSKFFKKSDGPKRSAGTITYRFIPQ
jgi:hypothetical protein